MIEKPRTFTRLPIIHKVIVDFFFPPRCVGCRGRGNWLCAECKGTASRVPTSICQKCGCPTPQILTCSNCWKTNPKFDAIRAHYFFDGVVRRAIHLFKYRRARYLVETLTQLLIESVEPAFLESDAIIPVPLHEKRIRERSYNQSQLLASSAGKLLGLDMVDDCLVRLRDTQPQMRLPAEMRLTNVNGAFACKDRRLAGKKVLLVDDVCTTGATINQCAAALKGAGASVVWAVCVARAR